MMKITAVKMWHEKAGSTVGNIRMGGATFLSSLTVLDMHIRVEADAELSDPLLAKWRTVEGIKSVQRLEKRCAVVVISGVTDHVETSGSEDVSAVLDKLPTN